ncbi:larval cuticle protein 65Ag1 [Drosophila grimshawi]|uniref:GH13967 n=1 Tax=Drosophila grimshawi TaxID=7222 RepID=B4K3V7_DROGR|nr:larval cuticle protein 65Ag1 [Drosophila grimshawi]EDW04683.1 GH13967 [Drosophila grimshawi]
MKFLIVFVALFAIALARPEVEIVRHDSEVGPEGYKFAVETSDGTSKHEEGHLKDAGTDDEAISVKGSYSWVDTDGNSHTLNYIADENGFQPEGVDVPKA